MPAVISRIAHFVGVGRGTDLLLYVLVIAFLLQILSSFRRNAALERRITRLARRIAIDNTPDKRQAVGCPAWPLRKIPAQKMAA